MSQQIVLYCPVEDDREELCELRLIRERTAERVKLQRAEAEMEAVEAEMEAVEAEMEAVEAENRAMKDRARRADKAKRSREARKHQRKLGYWIGAAVGMLMVLAWAFTKDTGITALPLVLGGILMGRMK